MRTRLTATGADSRGAAWSPPDSAHLDDARELRTRVPSASLARFGRLAGDQGNVLKRLDLLAHSRDLPMERAVLVYTTWPSIVEAERAGRSIVERRLAACVNILPGMISHYWWEGKIERAEEVVMLIKSRASMAEPLRETIRQLHSYTTPAFMVLPVENVDPEYHAWIARETAQ